MYRGIGFQQTNHLIDKLV